MHRFRIDAILDPQSLLRVTGHFAQRSIVPSEMTMQLLPDHMRIEVIVRDLDPRQAATIAAKLGEVFAVTGAEMEELAA
ncbi:hypothetical protein [Sphingopyxis sp. RIFCSPHIGHO2_12_FULL_65_19]|uniref:hypothetical protein n=1 Tax=Sphingopyxis sp. RIFCSPHIGHO2_12_FULL_65_19 TaxID=1802172 RepID=UPI0008D6632A|nr:hypothetical protein [Sphingopyxis sp. RIFCSPHIGHO2_12_FULL_65_19]OHD06396.1 MAG: hypothetical protein A3E77_00175 [Sphingopyxis sp. RIFCSPHIGHO2_12_FULL_65_19]